MADPQIRQVPVEFSLKLMAVVSTHRVDTEWKLKDNMVNTSGGGIGSYFQSQELYGWEC